MTSKSLHFEHHYRYYCQHAGQGKLIQVAFPALSDSKSEMEDTTRDRGIYLFSMFLLRSERCLLV